jgi:hypothetical protein
MPVRTFVFVSVLSVLSSAASAEQTVSAERALFDALKQTKVLAIMSEEGIGYADQIAEDMLLGHVTEQWDAIIAEIYNPSRMEETAFAGFERALAGQDIDAMLAFYSTDPGRQSVQLEIDARRAIAEPDIMDAATAAAIDAEGSPRYDQIVAYVEANDLIEKNISAALNDNYAFLMGLYDGGALDGQTSPESLISDVWAQEDEIRSSTSEWVYAFMMMAYQPLTDADLDTLIAFSQTEAGQGVNRALFDAFSALYEDISRTLGLQVAQMMMVSEL